MTGILWVFAIAVASGLISALLFDAFLRRMREAHNTEWVEAGSPNGYYFYPSGLDLFSLNGASHLVASRMYAMKLIFKTPDWAVADVKARRLILCYRLTALVAGISILTYAFMFFAIRT